MSETNLVKQEVGRRIYERRETLGLSMEQVALMVGLKSWQAVQQWECGKSSPKRVHMPALAMALETTADWINSGALLTSMVSDQDREILELIGYLTEEQRSILKEQLLTLKKQNETMFQSLSSIGAKLKLSQGGTESNIPTEET